MMLHLTEEEEEKEE